MNRLSQLSYEVIKFDVDDGNLTDEKSLNRYLNEGISHVYHLAGKTFVPDSWKDTYSFFNINVSGTLTVLEFCRKSNATFIYLSSYLYGEPQYLPIDENHPLKAFNPYGQSKLMAEELTRYYEHTFNIRSFIFRLFNVYGPRQPKTFLIPEIIHKIRDAQGNSIILNDLRPRRDYIYIDDVIDALLLSINGKPGVYNVGSGVSYSVKEIADYLVKIENSSKQIQGLKMARPNEVLDLYADIGFIKQEFGWEPKTDIINGLKNCLFVDQK